MQNPNALKSKTLSALLFLGIVWFASSACNSGPTRPPDTPIEPPCPLANPEDPCWEQERETSIVPTSPEPSPSSGN